MQLRLRQERVVLFCAKRACFLPSLMTLFLPEFRHNAARAANSTKSREYMYQSILSVLKSLIYDKKTGVLSVTNDFNEQASIFFEKGLIQQVEIGEAQGRKPLLICIQWLRIEAVFQEGDLWAYSPDTAINTNETVSLLEKMQVGIEKINKNIPSDDSVLCFDSSKLKNIGKINAKYFKIALLFNGKRTLKQAREKSTLTDMVFLVNACDLIKLDILAKKESKVSLSTVDRKFFLQKLDTKLSEFVGPATSFLVDDAFEAINSRTDTLKHTDIPMLIEHIGQSLDAEDKGEFEVWSKAYL